MDRHGSINVYPTCTCAECCDRIGERKTVTSWMSSCSLRTERAILLENALDSVKDGSETGAPLGSYLTADNLGPCLSL